MKFSILLSYLIPMFSDSSENESQGCELDDIGM